MIDIDSYWVADARPYARQTIGMLPSKPSCLALLSPKTNLLIYVLIKKFQFQTIYNITDHIDHRPYR